MAQSSIIENPSRVAVYPKLCITYRGIVKANCQPISKSVASGNQLARSLRNISGRKW